MNRQELINKYYTDLEYGINKNEAINKIRDLTSELKILDANNFANRLSKTASIIQQNFRLFVSICEHKDIVTSIIDYLKYFSVQIIHMMKGEFDDKNEIIELLILTIYNMNLVPEMILFLEKALVEDSDAEHITEIRKLQNTLQRSEHYCYNRIHYSYNIQILDQNIEMILLEESDLYAIIYYLKMRNIVSSLKKIWVQESIKQVFQWHIKKYLGHLNIPICTFQSKQELLMSEIISTEIKLLSIWSEDIVDARNFAMSFKRHVIFINTHMNFCAGILLPYTKPFCYYKIGFISEDETNAKYVKYKADKSYIYYNLFYNGMWKKPVKNMYYMHNNFFLANATSEDFEKCLNSATQGFKVWNAMPVSNRMYVLHHLVSTLEAQGESLLANVVSKWLKLPYYCINQLTRHETDQFEVTKIRESRGVIILEEKEKMTMFRELTQSLITGNSVIVICNPDVCTLTHYCDMFSTAMIPPGAINLLSSNVIVDIKYNNLADLKPEEVYAHLTLNKHIVICLK